MELYILLKNLICVFAWDYIGLYGNPWKRIGNDGIPHRKLCESAWGEISHRVKRKRVSGIKFCAQEPTRDMVAYKGNHMGLRNSLRKGKHVGWCGLIILTHVSTWSRWRCTHMVQHVKKLLTWSPMKEMIWDLMWWNSPHKNSQRRPCERYGWLKFCTGSHVGYATFL